MKAFYSSNTFSTILRLELGKTWRLTWRCLTELAKKGFYLQETNTPGAK